MAATPPTLMTNLPAAIEQRYKIKRDIGQGAYGLVCEAEDRFTGKTVAIKKVTRISDKEILAKRCLREIKLLRHFNGHDNIISIIDLEIADPNSFNEVYMIQELMEADLHQIIRSGQPLTDAHFQYFIFQICRGLKYIHSANVLHRDMKPGNLLVNADCELRICDFGLARGYADTVEGNAGFMTEYVATRWYRAPEIMLSFQSYTKAIDMWSVGCIFAEMLGGRPLFKGRDYVDQLNQILSILGMPDDATLKRVGSDRAQMYIKSLPYTPKLPFRQLYPNATEKALDLLERLLAFDPAKRITVEEALQHPYLEAYHEPEDEPSHEHAFDFSFESAHDIGEIKRMIVDEIAGFKATQRPMVQRRPSVRTDVTGGSNASGHHVSQGNPYDEQAGLAANAVSKQTTAPAQRSMDIDSSELERELAGGFA